MTRDLIPGGFWNFPSFLPSLWDEEMFRGEPSGLEVSEDDGTVTVKAHVPGIDPAKVEVNYQKGILTIQGEAEESDEDKRKKFYRRSSRSFHYQVAVPGNVDEEAEPQASCRNGVCTVTFQKRAQTKPKRIAVKAA